MAYEKFTGEEYIDTDLVAKLNQDFDACGKLASKNTWSADNDFTAGLTVHKTPTVNNDVPNKKYVDDSVVRATADLLRSNNTWTGSNIYRKNITVSNGTASGSEGIIDLGKPPTSKTKQPNIYSPGNGNLIINASENSIIALQSGDVVQWSIVSDEANKKTSAYLHSNLAATYTPATGVVWVGNANTATKLATARTIRANLASSTAGSFDGSANITVGVTGTLPIANGGTGATTAAAARTALGCAPAYTYSTTDLTAGSSALTTGTLYIVYE